MATEHHLNAGTMLGTASGMLLTVLANITSSDILKTVLLAAIGAVVSFLVSLALKNLLGRASKKRKKSTRL